MLQDQYRNTYKLAIHFVHHFFPLYCHISNIYFCFIKAQVENDTTGTVSLFLLNGGWRLKTGNILFVRLVLRLLEGFFAPSYDNQAES